MAKTIKETVTAFGLKQVLSYLDKDFEHNAPKVLD